MILTPNILARLVAIVVVGVLLQLGFFSQVALLPRQPRRAALPGRRPRAPRRHPDRRRLRLLGRLAARLPADRAARRRLAGPADAGYLAGLFRERFEIHSPLVPPLLCMGLTLFAELGFGAVELMLGYRRPVSPLVIRDLLLKSIFAFFLGWRSTRCCGGSCARRWWRSRRRDGARAAGRDRAAADDRGRWEPRPHVPA